MNKKLFAENWVKSWNSHDLEEILKHYSGDIEITTPLIKVVTGNIDGCLKGKDQVKEYWKTALDKIKDLHFEIYEIAEGVNSIAIYYKSVMNKKAIETMFFDEDGKINKMFAFYTD